MLLVSGEEIKRLLVEGGGSPVDSVTGSEDSLAIKAFNVVSTFSNSCLTPNALFLALERASILLSVDLTGVVAIVVNCEPSIGKS